ncbi:MAG: hypothetical protein GXO69_08420 [Acidobacteria bacterium]|nr:hypothetical protein [Acidobacteriota bacterium]
MAKNRRQIYFVDRLFQRRFILLFVIVAVLITAGNTLFYFLDLRPAVESAMYRSHITIHNPGEIVFQHAMRFSIVISISIIVIVIIFYSIMRYRLERFLRYLTLRMENLIHGIGRNETIIRHPGEEFQGLAPVLLEFMYVVDRNFERKQKIAAALRNYCQKPDPGSREYIVSLLKEAE